MVFNLVFHGCAILSGLFFFFLIAGLYVLYPAVITKLFNPTAELAMHLEIPTKELKAEIETHRIAKEAKNVFSLVKGRPNLFVLLTYQLILLYFFNAFLTYFFFSDIFC